MSNEGTEPVMDNESNLLEDTIKPNIENQPPADPANSFDERPIGGKRFDFSEFPAEGEELPKPKKVAKKPPVNK